MAHVHLKNLYMTFSYNEKYRKMPVILECRYHYSSESSCFTFSAIKLLFDHLFWCSQEVRVAKAGIRSLSRPIRGTSLKPTYRGGGFRRTATSSKEAFLALNLILAFFHLETTHFEAYISLSHSFISTIQLSNIRYRTFPTTVLAVRYTSRLEGIPDLPPPLTCSLSEI